MAHRARITPRKQPQQERSRATVDAILDATARILVQDGYDGASTNRIALKAGVSVGSLYQYFPSKEALVAALIDRHMEEMSARFAAQMSDLAGEDPRVVVREVIRGMISAHQVEPRLHGVLTEQIPRVGKIDKLLEINRRVAVRVRGYLESIQDRLVTRDLDTAVFLLVTTVEAVTHSLVVSDAAAVSAERVVDELTGMVCRYLFGAGG